MRRTEADSAEIYDVREYQAGDRMQKVHWKLSARENTLYIKEFSYPLGATVVLLMEEDTKGSRVGNLFMEAVVSLSAALLERECAHYVVWKKKNEDGIMRILVRTEEDLYECIMEVLEFSPNCLEQNMEEQYRYTYKNDIYATIVKIDTGMKLQIDGNEKMDMACDYKRIPIEISKDGSIFYHITFLRNRDSSFVDGKEEWKGSCVGCFEWKCFAFVSVKGGNSAGVIVVYQKKRSGNS